MASKKKVVLGVSVPREKKKKKRGGDARGERKGGRRRKKGWSRIDEPNLKKGGDYVVLQRRKSLYSL